MSSVVVSGLEFAHPGSAPLFFDVSFGVPPGGHAAIVGVNGAGKSTVLKILAGELEADDGEVALGGRFLSMPQDVGMGRADMTVREMLIDVAPDQLRAVGLRLVGAERALDRGDHSAGMDIASAIADWGDLGGYELEQRWEASAQRVVKTPIADMGERLVSELSGGERKRLVLDLLFGSDADILLLDEPDNYLDIPARRWLEGQITASPKTIVMVSHDRVLLESVTTRVVMIEGSGAWVHGESFSTFASARQRRQEQLGDELKRWNDEERRLFRHMKIMKQRAAANFKNATKANAAESRWERFVAAGPPPPPAPDEHIRLSLRGADAARRVIRLDAVGIDDLVLAFSTEVFHGERTGLIGPNGTGKSHLLGAIAGSIAPSEGSVAFGPRTSVGVFTQVNDRPDFAGRTVLDIVQERVGEEERARKAIARYGLRDATLRGFETLSGGQKARLEILCLELEGHNVLLLDEPTDNLDVDSAEALERALDGFEGTVLAVSHDRAFLSKLDRFVCIADSGEVYELPDIESALAALADPDDIASVRLAKRLTIDA